MTWMFPCMIHCLARVFYQASKFRGIFSLILKSVSLKNWQGPHLTQATDLWKNCTLNSTVHHAASSEEQQCKTGWCTKSSLFVPTWRQQQLVQIPAWEHEKELFTLKLLLFLMSSIQSLWLTLCPHFLAPSNSFRSELWRSKDQMDPTVFTSA